MADPVQILFSAPNLDAVKASVLGLIPIFDRVARQGRTAIERSAKEQVRAEVDATKLIGKAADQAAKEKERAARASAREMERISRDAQRAELNFVRAGQRAIIDAERERTRAFEAESRKRRGVAEAEAHAAEAIMRRRSRGFGNTVGQATGRVMGMAGRVAGVAAAIGGGFTVADALRSGLDEEKTAGVIFRGANQKGDVGSAKDVIGMAQRSAIATGGTTGDIMGGLDAFVRKTGDLGAAKGLLEDMAKLSAATGANFSDMGNTAAEVQNQLGDSAKTMQVMRALAAQGRAGAIDIKDLGQYGGRLAASAAMFTGDLTGNIESFGAIAQLAKKLGGATDTAEATESVARLGSDFAKNADKFKAIGVDVFSDASRTKFRNAEDVITESVVKSGGKIDVLKELFGERSIRAALGAQVAFANAGPGGGEAAIRAQFGSMRAATLTEGDIDQGVKERLAENEAKLNIATVEFHRALNDQLMPILPQLIDKFTQLIPHIERFLKFLINNPWTGVGGLVGAALALEIGKGAVVASVSTAFTGLASKVLGSMLSGAGAGVVPPGVSTTGAPIGAPIGALGTVMAGLAITATAVTITAAGVTLIDKAFEEKNRQDEAIRRAVREGGNAESALKGGLPGSREEAEHQAQRLAGLMQGAERNSEGVGGMILKTILGSVPGLGVGVAGADVLGKAMSPFGGLANTAEGAANFATGSSVGRSFSMIAQDEAAARAAGQVKEQFDALQLSLKSAAVQLQAFQDSMPKPDPSGSWPNGGPP